MAAPVKNIADGGYLGASSSNVPSAGIVNNVHGNIAIAIPVNPHSMAFTPIISHVESLNHIKTLSSIQSAVHQTTTLHVIYKERNINQVLSGQIHPRGDQ